jgi:hypothetical protein
MALAARQPALRRPAAIAVHDDGDVEGRATTIIMFDHHLRHSASAPIQDFDQN